MSESAQHTAAQMFKDVGQLRGMAHEQANRLLVAETRLANLETEMLTALRALPVEVRRFAVLYVPIGAAIGSFIGVLSAFALVREMLGQ